MVDPSLNEKCKEYMTTGTCAKANSCPLSHEIQTKICEQFAKAGYCKYGNQCHFSHYDEPKVCKNFAAGYCEHGDQCRFRHVVSKKSICNFYLEGNCNYGSKCRFDHPLICELFGQDNCKAGDQCDKYHYTPPQKVQTPKVRSDKQCPHLKSEGYCPNAETCTYQHGFGYNPVSLVAPQPSQWSQVKRKGKKDRESHICKAAYSDEGCQDAFCQKFHPSGFKEYEKSRKVDLTRVICKFGNQCHTRNCTRQHTELFCQQAASQCHKFKVGKCPKTHKSEDHPQTQKKSWQPKQSHSGAASPTDCIVKNF